ncbi:MAG: hypothetical protein N3C60_08805 [Calditerrivibrio sp.]|nr:hypothetical protein [Calditerrivibrio sp.]
MFVEGLEPNVTITTVGNEVLVGGDVVNITDYRLIKESVLKAIGSEGKYVKVIFSDAESLTSSVIGFFLKLVQKDNIEVKMVVKKNTLMSLLEILGLVKIFNVTLE